MPDEPNQSKNTLVIVAVLLLIGGAVGGWLLFRKSPNTPPVAALRVESLDETNRVATISDNGSHDPDGTIQSWRVGWGDGKEESLPAKEDKATHTYAAEGEYTVSLWCVDNRGATSSVPASTRITFDFAKRQQAMEQAQAEDRRQAQAKLEAERLKAEQAKKEAERLAQEKQKQMAEEQAGKAREEQALAEKQKAQAELARRQAEAAATAATAAAAPPPTPLAAGLSDSSSFRPIIFTPAGYTLGQFQISSEKSQGLEADGKARVVLVIRCVNFPNTPVPTSDWQIDGKAVQVRAGRIRAALSPGRHQVTALLRRAGGTGPSELKAEVAVGTTGDCVVEPR